MTDIGSDKQWNQLILLSLMGVVIYLYSYASLHPKGSAWVGQEKNGSACNVRLFHIPLANV